MPDDPIPHLLGQTDDEDREAFDDSVEQQAELEQLIREKGDYQAAVDAQRRGERPKGDPGAISSP